MRNIEIDSKITGNITIEDSAVLNQNANVSENVYAFYLIAWRGTKLNGTLQIQPKNV